MSPMQTYLRGIRKKFGYFPAWPPLTQYSLGDVGQVVDGQFKYLTTLTRLGIGFEVVVGAKGEHLAHTSGKSASVQIKAAGETIQGMSLPAASAGALVALSSTGAFVFEALGPSVHRIADQYKLTEQILDKFRTKVGGERQWREDWCVITEVVKADKVTVLISESGSATVELTASAPIPAGPVPLASAGVALSVTKKVGDVTTVLAASNQTPLFHLRRLKRSLLSKILGKVDTGDFVQAASGSGIGGLPANLLELPDDAEMVPVLGPDGKPMLDWEPRRDPPAPRPPTLGKKKRKTRGVRRGGRRPGRVGRSRRAGVRPRGARPPSRGGRPDENGDPPSHDRR